MREILFIVIIVLSNQSIHAQSINLGEIQKQKRKTIATQDLNNVPLQVARNPTKIPNTTNRTRGQVTPLGTYNPIVFAGSVNLFGSSANNTNPLSVNNSLGIISFTNRIAKWDTAFLPANANSGWIYNKWSSNFGQTWDSTFVRSEPSSNPNLSRYPSGGILNPIGNAVVADAFTVAAGPITTGGWKGSWFSSTHLVSGWNGNNYTGTNINSDKINTLNNEANQYFASKSMSSCVDKVYSVGSIEPYINSGDYTVYGARINYAKIVNNQVQWSFDSVKVDFKFDAINNSSETTGDPIIAFSEDGYTGYVMLVGAELGTSGLNGGYVPILFQSLDGGSSWSRVAEGFDWSSTHLHDILPHARGEASVMPMMFSTNGADATVDAGGNLHFFTQVSAGVTTDPDSLGYTWTSRGYDGLMFDVVFPRFGQYWYVSLIDTLYSGYASSTTGATCNTENVWTTASGKVQLNARMQISRSEDGQKIFFIWCDTDTSIANFCNVYPDIFVKGDDIGSYLYTPTFTISQGDQSAYNMYAADKVLSSGGNHKLGLTITKNSTTNADIPQYISFIDNAIINESQFMIWHGTIGLSKMIVSKNTNVNVSPNPFITETNLKVKMSKDDNIKVNVYNSLGALVSSKSVNGTEGENTISLDASQWPSGLYSYNIVVGNELFNGKIVLTK